MSSEFQITAQCVLETPLPKAKYYASPALPAFAPEALRRVRLGDMTRVKQMRAALEDLAEEGLIQVFQPEVGSQWIVGVVGVLQLDVMASRAQAGVRALPWNLKLHLMKWPAG